MWATTNCTPFAADATWSRNRDGVHEWIVAVKATYAIDGGGRLRLAEQQVAPLLAPEYRGEPGLSSLRYDADLVPPKPTTDVIVNGTAYAPRGKPAAEFPVTLRVGAIHKTIRALGDRRWGASGIVATAAEPVTSLPVVYERAYGGHDRSDADPRRQFFYSRNPVGRGAVARASHRAGQALPNFEYPDTSGAGPAGFGAIDGHWSPRRERGGTYDEGWQRTRQPLLPLDWDPVSLQCAPVDQRPAAPLRGGEPVELVNLTPSGTLRFDLPSVELVFRTYLDGRVIDHAGQLSTVILEPDVSRVILVWASSLLCRSDGDYLDETVIRTRARR